MLESSVSDTRVSLECDESVRYPSVLQAHTSGILPVFCDIEAQVRRCIANALGTTEKDCFADYLKPGDNVLIKPNQVFDKTGGNTELECLVAHWSLIYSVAKIMLESFRGNIKLIIGDSPLQGCDFENLVKTATPLAALIKCLELSFGVSVKLVDFRQIVSEYTDCGGQSILRRKTSQKDNAKYIDCALGINSMFAGDERNLKKYRTIDYPASAIRRYHAKGEHIYRVSKDVLDADVIINISKLKTHNKTGITAALKNLVGTLGDKQSLPHHKQGSPFTGGDEYAKPGLPQSVETILWDYINNADSYKVKAFWTELLNCFRNGCAIFGMKHPPLNRTAGGWYGNDTVWRGVLDINRLVIYADKKGKIMEIPQRRIINLIDGIVAGEGEGPLFPASKRCGCILAGQNSFAVDAVAAKLMGYDYRKIPMLDRVRAIERYPLIEFDVGDIDLRSNDSKWNGCWNDVSFCNFGFLPSSGWIGHIEID